MKMFWNNYHWHMLLVVVISIIIYKTVSMKVLGKKLTGGIGSLAQALKSADKGSIWSRFWANRHWVLGVVGVHLLFLYFAPKIWLWLASHSLFWVDHVVIAVVVLAMREEFTTTVGRKTRSVISDAGLFVLVALLIGNIVQGFGLYDVWKSVDIEKKEVVKEVSKAKTLTKAQVEVKNRAGEIFNANLSTEVARRLLNLVEEESHFRQFGDDGEVLRNGTAICAAQIKEDVWGADANRLGYNLHTLDGCLNMAVWITKNSKQGIDAWKASFEKLEARPDETDTFIAPIGEWSEVHEVMANCEWMINREIHIQDDQQIAEDSDQFHTFFPGQILNLDTKTFRIRSPAVPAGKMKYTCR